MKNSDEFRSLSDEEMAKAFVHGFIPSGCATPMYVGHFKGWKDTREEAEKAELDWLRQPVEEEHHESK